MHSSSSIPVEVNTTSDSETLPTVVFLATPKGRSAVATVCVDGSKAISVLESRFAPFSRRSIDSLPKHRPLFGEWRMGSSVEEVVLHIRSDERIEIHCHGGVVASRLVIQSIVETGAVETTWEEWLRSKSQVDRLTLTQLVSNALTKRTCDLALAQQQGAFADRLNDIFNWLDRGETVQVSECVSRLQTLIPLGEHLTLHWQVVILGLPNVGKSSLLNAIVGFDRALVYDQPGTTRDSIAVSTAIDGWPMAFTDTAGLRETSDPIEAEGVQRSRQSAARADLVLDVRDASDHQSKSADLIAFAPTQDRSTVIRVWNKTDRCNDVEISNLPSFEGPTVYTSAINRVGIDSLLDSIVDTLIPAGIAQERALPILPEQINLIAELSNLLANDDTETAKHLCQFELERFSGLSAGEL